MRTKLLGSFLVMAGLMCGPALAEEPRTYQTVNIFQAYNPSNILQGAAALVRSSQHADLRIATSGLDPNAAYSVWWVVFNNPSACVPFCNPTQLGNPAVRASVFYAAGFVTGIDGTVNLTAHLDAGALPIGVEVAADGTVAGLDPGNGFGAEIHVVLRSQGPIAAGMVSTQIGTLIGSFKGLCPSSACPNQQAAVFHAVAPHAQDW